MKRNKVYLILILFFCLNCKNQTKKDIQEVNTSNFDISKFHEDKLKDFLDGKELDKITINNIYEYARIDEGLKLIPIELAQNLLNIDTSFLKRGELFVSFFSKSNGYLVGCFEYHAENINRLIFTINDEKNMNCVDKLVVDKEVICGKEIHRFVEVGFIRDTLQVNYLVPIDINNNRFRRRPIFKEPQLYLLTKNGFERLRY